jgi:predicted Zn-ribbon and HTH transcriptional regulator
MIPIRNDNEILFVCLDCKKRFWVDGNNKPGESPCPDCKSNNIDVVTQAYDHRQNKHPEE